MMRWLWFSLFALIGLAVLAGGLLVPAHLRAVDASVVRRAGWDSPAVLQRGRDLASEHRLGAAFLLAQAAREGNIPGWDRLGEMVTNLARQFPASMTWGNDVQLIKTFADRTTISEPFTTFIIRNDNRALGLAYLARSTCPAVQEILRTRELKQTTLLPAANSASGQVFEAAVVECGLLLDGGCLTATMSNTISSRATLANRGGASEPLEEMLMDFVSLGERFNWDQLAAFVPGIPDAGTLHQLAEEARAAGGQLPVLFAAVQLTHRPEAIGAYLAKFPQSGLPDLAASLDAGVGGVSELTERQQRLYNSPLAQRAVELNPFRHFLNASATYAFHRPRWALASKWLAYCVGGFFFAAAVYAARPAAAPLERSLQVRGLHYFYKALFSLGFLFVVLILSEPFLAQESQPGSFSLRLRLPASGGPAPAAISRPPPIVMNPIILLTVLLFFVLQALIYLACLLKLAEIRRQALPPRMKLKLLENEDLLFDAGLYLSFVGTIVSLILASRGWIEFSLMAAYSSTSFGIIFVCIFKIFHLRPARRKLLLEAEAADVYAVTPSAPSVPELSPS